MSSVIVLRYVVFIILCVMGLRDRPIGVCAVIIRRHPQVSMSSHPSTPAAATAGLLLPLLVGTCQIISLAPYLLSSAFGVAGPMVVNDHWSCDDTNLVVEVWWFYGGCLVSVWSPDLSQVGPGYE